MGRSRMRCADPFASSVLARCELAGRCGRWEERLDGGNDEWEDYRQLLGSMLVEDPSLVASSPAGGERR